MGDREPIAFNLNQAGSATGGKLLTKTERVGGKRGGHLEVIQLLKMVSNEAAGEQKPEA